MIKEISWENWLNEVMSLWGELGHFAYGMSIFFVGGFLPMFLVCLTAGWVMFCYLQGRLKKESIGFDDHESEYRKRYRHVGY